MGQGCSISDVLGGDWRGISTSFVQTSGIVGVGPMEKTHAECQAAGRGNMIIRSEYFPAVPPILPASIDLAAALSVFTHISRAA
jgi:hypothetical protein